MLILFHTNGIEVEPAPFPRRVILEATGYTEKPTLTETITYEPRLERAIGNAERVRQVPCWTRADPIYQNDDPAVIDPPRAKFQVTYFRWELNHATTLKGIPTYGPVGENLPDISTVDLRLTTKLYQAFLSFALSNRDTWVMTMMARESPKDSVPVPFCIRLDDFNGDFHPVKMSEDGTEEPNLPFGAPRYEREEAV